jgi:EAL domain-containing protein (putative c-di-GMP-specific phosphodiesterase class I)
LASRKLRIENGLHSAVENNEMYLVYQPKVSVLSGQIEGAEALLRWDHPELGALSPVEFVPIAESTGLIVPIGQWVLEVAARQSVLFRQMGHPDFRIAVNVSIRQLNEDAFHGKLCAALSESGLPADALIVELTENMLMENADDCISRLQKIKRVGVQLSIDDFGTGYSSLSYLQRFPIDQLKIDLSFIKVIQSAQDKAPIVKAIISLAHDLGMNVVAEGVETRVQLDRLKLLNCEQYQGFYKSKPVSAQDFAQLLYMDTQKIA